MTFSDFQRPDKFGPENRRFYITQDSEVSFRAITANGKIFYFGRAKVGGNLSEPIWQLRKIEYDLDGQVTAVKWPVDDLGVASSYYTFQWGSLLSFPITSISTANPCHVTASNTLSDGARVYLSDILGPQSLNFDGTNLYTVANASPSGFDLVGIDSSSLPAYQSGGLVNFALPLQNEFI